MYTGILPTKKTIDMERHTGAHDGFTRIFPFKKTDGMAQYWAAVYNPALNIQRVFAFGSLEKLQEFLAKGIADLMDERFAQGRADIRPYTLIASMENGPFFSMKDNQPVPSYLPGLQKHLSNRTPLTGEEFAKCTFYMGFQRAQAVAKKLEDRLESGLSQKERDSVISMLGRVPIQDGDYSGTIAGKRSSVYGDLPNRMLNCLVDNYLAGLAGEQVNAKTQMFYKALDYVMSNSYSSGILVDILLKRASLHGQGINGQSINTTQTGNPSAEAKASDKYPFPVSAVALSLGFAFLYNQGRQGANTSLSVAHKLITGELAQQARISIGKIAESIKQKSLPGRSPKLLEYKPAS